MSDFEDPTQLARCIKSDCEAYRAGNTPLCAAHLREQEVAAGASSISEPELEAKVAAVRTEDDEHPGMVKVYDRKTGEPSWVPAAPRLIPPPQTHVLMDPDINGGRPPSAEEMYTSQQVPDPRELEPRWNGRQWVLEEKRRGPDLKAIESLVRDLMHELGIREEDGDDHA